MSKNKYRESLTLTVNNLYINFSRAFALARKSSSGCLEIVQSATTDEGVYTPAQSCCVFIDAEECQEISEFFAKAGRKLQGIEP